MREMKSHLISQVILKQFANPQKEVLVHDVNNEASRLEKTEDVAFREVDRDFIGDLEKRWDTEIESEVQQAIQSLENGDLLHSDKHMKTIKRVIALHYIRTQAHFAAKQIEAQEAYRQKIIDEVSAQYPDQKKLIEERVAIEWPVTELKATIGVFEKYIPKVEKFLDKHGLEVGVAPEGSEFIIGDVPVVTADGDGNFGMLNGVAITDARSVAMPLTPKYIVAIKTKPSTKKYRQLTKEQVEKANSRQTLLAMEQCYSKPEHKPGIYVLYFNGLGTGKLRKREELAIKYLAKRGIYVTPARINWRSHEAFPALFKRMTKLTQSQLKEHGKVVLVGSSAGGSLAVNILARLHSTDLRAITLCSRLNISNLAWWDSRTLERMAHLGTPQASQSFSDSVTHCGTVAAKQLSKADKERLILVRQWADFVVPRRTMGIDGVQTFKVSAIGHGWGIALAVRRLPKILSNP